MLLVDYNKVDYVTELYQGNSSLICCVCVLFAFFLSCSPFLLVVLVPYHHHHHHHLSRLSLSLPFRVNQTKQQKQQLSSQSGY